MCVAGARGDLPDILTITDVFVHCPQLGSKAGNLPSRGNGFGKAICDFQEWRLPEAAIDGVTGVW